MESQSSKGITESDFGRLLNIFSDWYDQRGYLNMLKVLYRDCIPYISQLYRSSHPLELLNLLVDSGYLHSRNISILYDTIKVTKQFGLEEKIRDIIPSCPNIRGVKISNFTSHRQRIMKFGMSLTMKNVSEISALYNEPFKKYADSWSLIFDLENQMVIVEERITQFIDSLKMLELGLVVNALTTDLKEEIPIEILARGPEALKAFNEALSEAETEVNQGTTIFLGLERVGKTSTINSFLDHPFNPNEDITDAIANIRTVCPQEPSDESNWKETARDHSGVTGIYEEKMVDAIVKELEKESEKKVPVAAEKIAITKRLSPVIVERTEDIQGQSSSGVETEPERKKRCKNTQQTQPIDSVPKNIADKLQERMNQMKFKGEATSEWQNSSKDFIMNIWDFGGQPIYHVIQRIFLVSFAIVCVVFNLEDDLDAPAKVRDPTTGKMYEHRMTNLEFILYWIRAVYTNSRPDSKLDDSQLSPPVLVIGTHLGSLKGNEQEQKNKAEEIFSKIRQALEGKPYEAMVFSTYFAIENSLPFSKSNASSIMSQIFKFAKKMVRTLPLKWLRVQQEIQKKRETNIYLPTSEVIDLIGQCGVKVEAQRVLLEYLHDIGEILYFPDDEDLKLNTVLDLMKLVDMFKTVITVIDPKLMEPLLKNAWRRLDSGILEERLLRHLWKKFNFSNKTFNFFISLMQKFGLVCEKKITTGGERFFYVLSRLKPERVNSPPTEYGNRAVSIFHDFSNYLPDDVFQRGATKFIEKFQIEDNAAKLSYEHVELNIDELHHVVLNVATIKHRRMVQTTIIRLKIFEADQLAEEDEPLPTVCKKVLNFLETKLKTFCLSRARGVELTKYIKCECSPNLKDAHMHVVRKFNKNVLPCGSNGIEVKRYRRLFEGYEPLLQDCPVSQEEVTKPKGFVDDSIITTVAEELNFKGKIFGVRLGLAWSKVNLLCGDKIQIVKGVTAILECWRNQISSETDQCKVLCTALIQHGFRTLAKLLFDVDDDNDTDDDKTLVTTQAGKCFSDQDLLFICNKLEPQSWRRLGLRLGLMWVDINRIIHNKSMAKDHIMELLVTWRDSQSKNQMPMMIQALRQQKLVGLSQSVCERHGYSDESEVAPTQINPPQLPTPVPGYLADLDLVFISEQLDHDWKDLGIYLGMKRSEINLTALDYSPPIIDACIGMLVQWRESREADVNHLETINHALNQLERRDIIEELKIYYQEKYQK